LPKLTSRAACRRRGALVRNGVVSTLLFAAQPAAGHLNPMLSIARRLRENGHRVVFAVWGPRATRRLVQEREPDVRVLRPALGSLSLGFVRFTSGSVEAWLAVRSFFAGLVHYTRAMEKLAGEIRPDAIVGDFAFPAAGLAAELRGLPHAVVWSAGLLFSGEDLTEATGGRPASSRAVRAEAATNRFAWLAHRGIERAMRRTRGRLGLPPSEGSLVDWFTSPWLTMMTTAEAIEAPGSEHSYSRSTFFIGPCFSDRANPAGELPFERLGPDLPVVYASLGTAFDGRIALLRRIVSAFDRGDCQLIVSAGAAYDRLRSGPLGAHVTLCERVPQVELLPHVDAVISHGGNNTVNETLAAGKPLLVLPIGAEQAHNARRVVELGAGLGTAIQGTRSREIHGSVRRLLDEPSFRERALECARALAETDGPGSAVRLIERLIETRQPVLRAPGQPLTLGRDSRPPWQNA